MLELLTVENGVALLTLTALEIVLGIDNIVFIAILTGNLPEERRAAARRLGIAAALVTRLALLFAIGWIMSLSDTLFEVGLWGLLEHPEPVTGKDLVLLAGGLFLMLKATKEIHHKVAGNETPAGTAPDPARGFTKRTFGGVIFQIAMVDIVFSLDSVITAVGMAESIWIMVTAVVIAVIVMLLLAGRISAFVERYPTLKMLALAFLLLIGFTLVVEGLTHPGIPKAYIYTAMGFSLGVEVLNLRASRRRPAA